MSKHPVFCSLLQRLHDDHGFSPDPSCALAEFLCASKHGEEAHNTSQGVQDHVVEGEQGWVLQGVLSRASFRRAGASGQKVFAVSSLHISNFFCQEKGYCQDHPGDFNGTAWRCRSRNNLSTFDEVFSDCALPTPPGPTPLWGPGSIPNNWADVCGFSSKPALNVFGM